MKELNVNKKDILELNRDKNSKGMNIIQYLRSCNCEIIESYTKGSIFEALIKINEHTLILRSYNDIITSIKIKL